MSAQQVLAEHTSFHLGGPARQFLQVDTEAEFIAAIASADEAGTPVLILGGGSNVLVSDAGFDGLVIRDMRAQVRTADISACGGATVTVSAGHGWDDFVQVAIEREWIGIEALSGIPGCVGATPVQNVGAYGQEVSDTIAAVTAYDRARRRRVYLAASELGFSYRNSALKRSLGADFFPTPRFVVLEVTFQFRLGNLSAPLRAGEVTRTLGLAPTARAELATVRAAVLQVRRGKGMVLDEADHDTWSAGSFFTNPIVAADIAAGLPDPAPRWPLGAGQVKTSAAWLIEQAGFTKGYGLPGPAALSTKHVLALTNRGDARAADVVALARTVRAGVLERFGIELVPEPVLVGLRL